MGLTLKMITLCRKQFECKVLVTLVKSKSEMPCVLKLSVQKEIMSLMTNANKRLCGTVYTNWHTNKSLRFVSRI